MYARLLRPPQGSVFLFGPRGTGKSTWIREHFPDAVTYNLLDTREALRLERDPHTLYDELRTLPEGSSLGRYGRGLSGLRNALAPAPMTCYGVFCGERPTMSAETEVLPVRHFLDRLWQGQIIR